MIVLLALLVALLPLPLLGGRPSRLAALRLQQTWLLPVALGGQVLVISIFPHADEQALAAIHIATYVLAGVFVWRNRAVPGLILLGAGALSNGVTIALNGGTLPASATALRRSGFDAHVGQFTNSGVMAHPVLPWFGDVFWVPASWPLSNVFSAGDVLIVAGAAYGIHAICGSRLPRPSRRHRTTVLAGEALPAIPAPRAESRTTTSAH